MNTRFGTSTLMTLSLLATAVAGLQGCAEAVDTETGDFANAPFAPATVTLTAQDDSSQRLALTGTAAGETTTLYVDLSTIELPAGATLDISGENFFDAGARADYMSNPENHLVVFRAFALGDCAGCSDRPTWQSIEGSLRIDEVGATRVRGFVDVTVEGDVPHTSLRGIRTTISGPFEVVRTPVETPVVNEPAPVEQPIEAPVEQPVEAPVEQPVVGGQDTPAGAPASAVSETFEVTLTAEWGVNLATGDLISKANFQNSDLRATKGSSWLKLTPGGPTP